MIERHTFRDTLFTLRDYIDGLNAFEKSLGTYFNDNFLTNPIDKTITILAQGFFDADYIDEYFVGSSKPCHDCDETFITNFETIEDLLYHYVCSSDFGRELGLMDDTYVIKAKDGSVLKTFDGNTPEDVYSIIIKFLSRDDDNIHIINCSTVGRRKKNETDIS